MHYNNDFKDVVFNRRSIKRFNPEVKIPHDEMRQIIEETTKAPSSINMQPWRFIVVESEKGKDTLRPLIQYNTNQNDTSAAMIIIFGDLKCYEYGERIYNQAVEEGIMSEEVKNYMMENLVKKYEVIPESMMKDILLIDGGLAAMQLMLVARHHGYDTNAIGGFEKDKIAEAFGLDPDRYVPVVTVAIGERADDGRASVRLPADAVMTFK